MFHLFKSSLMVLFCTAALGMMLSCSSGNHAGAANDAGLAIDEGDAAVADKPPTAVVAAVDVIPQNPSPAPAPAVPPTPTVNLYFVSKDLPVEVVSSEMVCKMEAVGPEPKCRMGDLKVSEKKLYLDKSRNNLTLPNNVVSWESPCPDAANFTIRSIVLCASAEQFMSDVTTP
jgi:hypothetical protein